MLHLTLRSLWARKRRLVGTSLAVILGVGFLAATLILGDTFKAGFGTVFEQANAGTDVIVRSATAISDEGGEVRAPLDASVVDRVRDVPGVAAAIGQTSGPAQILDGDGHAIGGQGPPTLASNWITDPALNPYHLTEGRAPGRDGEIVIDRGSADVGHLDVGDRTIVRTPEPLPVTVVGIAEFGSGTTMGGATYVGFTDEQATTVLGRPGQVSSVLVRGDGSRTDADLRGDIGRILPRTAEAITGAELTAEQRAQVDQDFLGAVRTFLLAFAGVALVVATFSIHNTFTILIAQRSREAALLRAIGASRRQILGSVLLESLLIGVTASALGLAAGLGLARGLQTVLARFGLDLPSSGQVVASSSLLWAATMGIVVTAVASAAPAIRASRVAPIEALRDAAAEPARASRLRAAVGAVVAALGVALTVAATSSGDAALARAGLGALLVVLAAVILGPVIARPAASLVGAPIAGLRGQPGRLARRNAMRNPRRTAGSALALLIGTAVVAVFATFGTSIQASIDQTVDQSFGGDLVITQDSFSGSTISPTLSRALDRLPEVGAAVGIADAAVRIDGRDQHPTATDPARLSRVLDLDDQAGSVAGLEPGQLAVGTTYAQANGLRLGSPLDLQYADGARQRLRVGAIYAQDQLLGDLIMTTTDWSPHAQRAGDVAVLVELAPGTSLADGRAAVERVSDRLGRPTVQDREQYIAQQAGQIDQLLTLVYGLLGLAVVIALMGIANTLSLSIHERTRELGLLRAVGLTRSGLRSVVRWESVITAVVGTIVGLGVGTFLSWGVVQALSEQEGGIIFRPATQTLGLVVALAVVAGVAAAARPARRAARLDVLDAIAGR